jgi:HAD superfamily hydrolase (TIGR01459 family)
MTLITTLAAIAPRFDAFLVDQFGVLVDGSRAYPFAPKALSDLAAMGKRVVILSNSGKRSAPNEARLSQLGFDRASYAQVLSSGEVAFRELSRRLGSEVRRGARVLVLARDDDLSSIAGLDLVPCDRPEEAELILLAGSRGDEKPLQAYAALLEGPARRGVPCLCTNPDREMLTRHGKAYGAGRIAELYADLGGPVDWIGKPHPLIYRYAAEALGHPPADRVLCIGDSPAHDVRGGKAAGHVTALTRTGLHADVELETLLAGLPPQDRPDMVIPRFSL